MNTKNLIRCFFFNRMSGPVLAVFCLAICLVSSQPAAADTYMTESPVEENAPETADPGPASPRPEKEVRDGGPQSGAWPPNPKFDNAYDWIQLTSHEWLKGELKFLYEEALEFDSDEMDLQVFDWEDIRFLRTRGTVSVGLDDRNTVSGHLIVDQDTAYIGGEAYDRARILTIVYGEPRELNYWSFDLSLGADFQRGNTDQINYSLLAGAIRRTSRSRLISDYLGNFSRTNDVDTANNHRLGSTFDLFLSKKFFARPAFGEIYHDPFQNLAYRVTVGAGLGYHIIDTSRTEWDITAGPAYRYIRFDSVEEGNSDTSSTPAVFVGTTFDTELTRRIDFFSGYRFQYGNKESGGYTHHFINTLEIELTSILDLDLSWIWDRISHPTADAEGVAPEPDDFQFIVALGFDF
jgi:hypothetical protein